ncbi:hypothetical protein SHI21_12775 [Bacteriovorax sp. PP10]|uniref:Uncharacterized protein n=1 Tax=Bacteriovorax antarcticus TaxID=3088717 RepID=A0ABU5VVV0_9BACT|nr:hypothetical protein [Bacteriovorax sp. PP10]MEA9357091.1 hypothetical protein [Bacteriovorax sp. PP10]
MKKLINVLENKRSIAGLFILAGLIFTTYSIQENSGQVKRLTNFESGIQTCFTRVNQTYTANLLGDTTSTYLTQNFQNLTEECLAEGILTVENSFQKELSGTAKLLSNLASNVHWFHEDILAPNGAKNFAANAGARDVGSRFEKIETTKDEILESTNTYKTQITNSQNVQKNFFFISATLLVILMIAEYMGLTRRRLSNNARENEAHAELLNNGGGASVKVGEIIRVALEQNNLMNCSKLFSNFHAYAISEKGRNKMSLETLVTPMGVDSKKAAFTIDKIWEDDSIGVSADNTAAIKLHNINLESMSSNVVDLLAEKLFSQGVQIDMNISETLEVCARQEELEQTLFHLFSYAINSTQSSNNGEKNISVFAHKLGDVVAFDLIHSGGGFEEAILKQRVGLGDTGTALDLDLQICQSLLNEVQAKIQLDNKLDQNGDVIGGRVKIIFKAAVASTETGINQGRLVDLKVGSKKEILAAMSSESSSTI